MKTLQDDDVVASTPGFPSPIGEAAEESSCPGYEVHLKPRAETGVRWDDWGSRSVRWSDLMKAAQAGDNRAYEQLLREVDAWLSRYYARRLPHPTAEDARQDVLLAIHAKRHTYNPSRPFGAWITAIARYKWIDRIRDASRYSALSLDEEIPIEGHEGAAISAATLDLLLGKLKPAQESVIRLVKLKGLSVARASGVTGQSTALVKINIHRGLKKLADLVS
jgi:RNA polymerase sigma factor (sigma-70 family)